jgi:hypothetical protein
MGAVWAAVTVACVLTVINLVFSFGVIKRLRDLTERFETLGRAQDVGGPVMMSMGDRVEDFAASTVDGEPVSRELLAGTTLVAFLSTHCEPCAERLPQFIDMARDHPGGRQQVLAIVVGGEDASATRFTERLVGVARVIREDDGAAVQTAFGVRGYPALGVIASDGTVLASGFEVTDITASLGA